MKKWFVFLNVLVASILGFFGSAGSIISDDLIRGALHLSSSQVVWNSTLFLLGVNTIVPFANQLADRFGSKLIYQSGILLGGLGSLLTACATNFSILASGRWIEGAGTGFTFTIGLAYISRTFPKNQLSLALNMYLGLAFGVGLGFGIPLAGYFAQFLSWRTFYLAIVFIELLIVITAWFWFDSVPSKKIILDWGGFFFFALFFSLFLIALMTGQLIDTNEGWRSLSIRSYFFFSFISLCIFFWIEQRHPNPIVPLELFQNAVFILCCISLFLLGMSFFSSLTVASDYLINSLRTEKYVTGKICSIYGICMVVGSLLSSVLSKKIPIPILTLLGLTGVTISYHWNNIISLQTGWNQLMPILAARGFSLGIALGPTNVQAMQEIRSELISHAATLLTFFRQVGSTFSGAVITILTLRRQIFHSTRWGEQMSEQLPGYQYTYQKLRSIATPEQAKMIIIDNIENQAMIQAQNDAFYLFGIVTMVVGILLIVLNLRRWWTSRLKTG